VQRSSFQQKNIFSFNKFSHFCKGDFGSPLVKDETVIGITSKDAGCSKQYSTFTKVSGIKKSCCKIIIFNSSVIINQSIQATS
jgi:hypothetical protein